MAVRQKNRGLVYIRRSTSRQEASLEIQLQWAIGEALRLNIALEAETADLARMQNDRLNSYRDIRLDDGITGANLKRPGFMALRRDATSNSTVSHLFIYQRDRFGRPEDANEMVMIEKGLRHAGLSIVYRDGIAAPMQRGQVDVGQEIAMFFGYYESGEFLRKLAERVISAQRLLAENGYRTGGNAPYGFGRVLVDSSGQIVQELPPGRTARQPGCHVRIIPRDEKKIGVWLYLLELKEKGWGYKRIAQHFNELGIPSPGAGTARTDQGVKHYVSGKWCINTVKELCANRAILGLQDYGRRSEGAHRRLGPDGPRLLTEADRLTEERTRVVMNDPSVQITSTIGCESRFDESRWRDIQTQTEARGQSQRGVPRAKDRARYPLSCRLVDLTDGCGSILYGLTNGGRALYKCGRYMRTVGAECQSNSVDAEAMLRFTLRTIGHLVDRRGNRDRLRALLEERAQHERAGADNRATLPDMSLESKLIELKEQLEVVGRRMAKEGDDARYEAIAREYDRLHEEVQSTEAAMRSERRSSPTEPPMTIQDEVEAAMGLLDNIERITQDHEARAEINPLLESLGLRIGLTFGSVVKGKTRAVRRLLGGVMAFGESPLPVPLHGYSSLQVDTMASSHPDGNEGLGSERPGAHLVRGCESAPTLVECSSGRGGLGGVDKPLEDCVLAGLAHNHDNPIPPSVCRQEGISITKVNRGERI